MKIKLRINKDDIKVLKRFNDLDSKDQNYIIEQLQMILPESPLEKIEEISNNTDLKPIEVREFLNFSEYFYFHYYIFKYNLTTDEYIKEVITSLFEKQDIKLKIDDQFSELLKKILDMEDSIGVIAKHSSLVRENPNHFANARIITDLRQIYYNDPSKTPRYSLIKHTLSIKHVENNRFKEMYFTLDLDDLINFKKIIERAIDKEKTLNILCDKKNMTILKEVDWFD